MFLSKVIEHNKFALDSIDIHIKHNTADADVCDLGYLARIQYIKKREYWDHLIQKK